MSVLNIKIAGTVFCVKFRYSGTADRLERFITSEPAAYTVTMGQPDLEAEYDIHRRLNHGILEDKFVNSFRAEFNVLHRKISHLILNSDTLLVHGSCVVADGEAYLFIAPSGAGKSTHTQNWLRLLGGRAYILNDDKPMIALDGSVPMAYATPWGLVDACSDDCAPLRAVTVLKRGSQNIVKEISGTQMFIELFKASIRGDSADEQKQISVLQNRLTSSVKCYSMSCTEDIDAARTAIKKICGND